MKSDEASDRRGGRVWARGLMVALLLSAGAALVAAAPLRQDQATDTPGQDEPAAEEAPGPKPPHALDPEKIKARLAELEAAADAKAAKPELDLLKQAASWLEKAAQERAERARLEQAAQSAPTQLTQIQAELVTPLPDPVVDGSPNQPVDELTPSLQAARTQLEAARSRQQELEREATRRTERRSAVPVEIAADAARAEKLAGILAAPSPAGEGESLAAARRWATVAEQEYLRDHTARLEQEIRSYDAQRELLRAQRQRAERRVLAAQQLLEAWDALVASSRANEAGRVQREAEQARRDAAGAHHVVREIAEENSALADRFAAVSARLLELNKRQQQIDEKLTQLSRKLEASRQLVEQVGLIEAIGYRLRSERLQLPDVDALRRQIRSEREEMREIQVELMDLEDRRLRLLAPAEEAERRLAASSEPVPPERRDDVLGATQEALANQSKLINDLSSAGERFFQETLLPLQQAQADLVKLTTEFRNFIDERVLWIQSSSRLSVDDFSQSWSSIVDFTRPALWRETARQLVQGLRADPIVTVLGAMLILTLIALRRRMRARLKTIAEEVDRPLTDRMSLTGMAIVITVLLAAGLALPLWFLGWRLEASPDQTPFSASLASALTRVGVVLFALLSLYEMSAKRSSLGSAHFAWPARNLKLIRRELRWFLPVALPIGFVTLLASQAAAELNSESLGRVGIFLLLTASTILTFNLFHPRRGMLQSVIAARRGGWLERLRYVWFPALLGVPAVLAIASALGYVYTAVKLARDITNTYMLVLFAVVGYHLLLRWLNVAQTRLAIEQARKKRAAQAEAAARARAVEASGAGESPKEAPGTDAAIDEDDLDVAAVSSQSVRMVRSLMVIAVVVLGFNIWSDVLPALGILDQVELWSTTKMTTTAVGADGEMVETAEQIVPVTLKHLAIAMLVLVVTFVVSKNIAGLLEVLLLQRLPITSGARYATTTVSRYAVIIIGLVLAFNAISIGWSRVQWLAAAITVGLGFGLQEIVANFVSGLILLFERPIRVGDVVTVGTVSGTVTRIRMRATTVMDWDRKEMIIPNKTFITGEIVNWSLSDTVLRVTIPVGVAYGSDTELARKLLLDVAHANERVLRDPAPVAVFLGFGDSALNFELRAYLPHVDHLLAARHELHQAINDAFRKAKVEIAFPQRDLNIRNLPPGWGTRRRESEDVGEPLETLD